LRNAMIMLVKDKILRKRMGEESRKIFEERFNNGKNIKKIIKLYEK